MCYIHVKFYQIIIACLTPADVNHFKSTNENCWRLKDKHETFSWNICWIFIWFAYLIGILGRPLCWTISWCSKGTSATMSSLPLNEVSDSNWSIFILNLFCTNLSDLQGNCRKFRVVSWKYWHTSIVSFSNKNLPYSFRDFGTKCLDFSEYFTAYHQCQFVVCRISLKLSKPTWFD